MENKIVPIQELNLFDGVPWNIKLYYNVHYIISTKWFDFTQWIKNTGASGTP